MTDVSCAPGPARGYWLRIALVIAGATAVTSLGRVLFGGTGLVDTFTHAVVYSACIGVLAGLIVPPIHHRLESRGAIVEWAATLLGLLVVAVVGTAVVGTFVAIVVLGLLGYHREVPWPQRFAASFELNLLITAIIGVAMTLYENQRSRLDALTLELRTQELARERERKMALEARLTSLEARLHPHFLFNTLNAISELIHENPDRAERTVERLATLLRAALDATEQATVPLTRELEIVGDYLEIEKTRLGERLTYGVHVAPEAAACDVLPLAVQTLVENSIKHAVAPRPGGGRVRVEGATSDGRVVVSVWDDGPGFALSAAVPGHGLENLQSRLHARYGGAASLDVTRRDGGTLVTVSLPRAAPVA